MKAKYYFQIPVFPKVYCSDEESENYDDYVLDTGLANNPAILQKVADSWNSERVHQYLALSDAYRPDVMGEGIFDSHAFVDTKIQGLMVEITTEYILNDKEIAFLRDEISGQCSDGWGEGFEQQEQYYNGDKLYISPWTHGPKGEPIYAPDYVRVK